MFNKKELGHHKEWIDCLKEMNLQRVKEITALEEKINLLTKHLNMAFQSVDKSATSSYVKLITKKEYMKIIRDRQKESEVR